MKHIEAWAIHKYGIRRCLADALSEDHITEAAIVWRGPAGDCIVSDSLPNDPVYAPYWADGAVEEYTTRHLSQSDLSALAAAGLESPRIICIRRDAQGYPDRLIEATIADCADLLHGWWNEGEGVADIRWYDGPAD